MNEKRIKAEFYRTPGGAEPVRDWLKEELDKEDMRIVGKDLLKIEMGFPIGMPVCRPLGRGLWECRSNLTGKKIGRVIFCVDSPRMVLLHAFVKKDQKTPQQDIELALARKKEIGL